jgi:hypothetical protein
VTSATRASSSVRLDISVGRERSFRAEAFGDSVALTSVSEAKGRSPSQCPPPSKAPAAHAYGSVFGGNKLLQQERHYGYRCPGYKYQLELDLRDTQPHLSALRSQHDWISLPRILSQRLASGLGTGDLPWIKGSRTAFGEIVRETWAVKPLLLRRSPGRILKSSLPHDDSSTALELVKN